MKFSKKLIAGMAAVAVLSASGVAMAAGRPADDASAGYGAANGYAVRTVATEDGAGLGYAYGLMGGFGFHDADGDGVCDGPLLDGSGNAYGFGAAGFVDADGDGVCDTCGEKPALDGSGNAYGAGRGAANYADADGDGVCDNDGVRALDGTGNRGGRARA